MRTKREPRIAKNANQPRTRGVRKLPARIGRPNPYGVQWSHRIWDPVARKERRKVETEFYSAETARDQRFDELVAEKRTGVFATATRDEVAEWRAFQAAIAGARWQDVVANHMAWLRHNGVEATTHTLKDAAKTYLNRYAKWVAAGQRAVVTEKKVKKHVQRFIESFGHMRLDDVTADQIEEWIDGLDDVESDATFNTYRRDLHAFFEHFHARGETKKNPVGLVRLRDELSETVAVLSIEQTAKLLHTCYHHFDARNGHRFRRILPRIALETFAGLRHSSALRIAKGDLNPTDRGITLPKRKVKNKRRFYVAGFDACLWQWLDMATERDWEDVDGREYRFLKSELFEAAAVPHPHNCLRHGFASYQMAATKNEGLIAYWLCHTNVQQLRDHYNGRATEADGQRFKLLSPDQCARIVRGSAVEPQRPVATPQTDPAPTG